MSKKQIDVYRTGIYLRLSQGDEDIDGLEKKESNSISNQKLLLEGFIDAHDDLKLVDIFIDDGYSGSNFDRPEFQRMMTSMKAGKLDCIIVKDLSRLARERIGADELIQKTFKKYNVRFIAVSEGYDSLTASSSETHTIIPFKNLLNEQYNGDTSIKVRTSQGILRRNGLFIGAFALAASWSNEGVKGCRRFLERVWKLQDMLTDEGGFSKDMETKKHQNMKKD